MGGDFSEPPQTIVGLVPEVSSDGEDGVAKAARPSLLCDVALAGGQETGAPIARELALRGTDAQATVRHIRLPVSQGRVDPVLIVENVLTGVKEIRFTLPGWPKKAFPACLVEDGDGSAPAADGSVAGNLFDLQERSMGQEASSLATW